MILTFKKYDNEKDLPKDGSCILCVMLPRYGVDYELIVFCKNSNEFKHADGNPFIWFSYIEKFAILP